MLFINICKRNNSLNVLFLCILSISILSACGLSGERGGTNGQTSSNGGNGNGGLENDIFKIKEVIGIRVEPITGAPNNISTAQISIVTLNENFREVGSNLVPSYRVVDRLSGGYEIQFSDSYIERINQVVKVTFNNNSTPKNILYAPLYTVRGETESITVNAKSHYLLKKLFDTVDSATQLTELLPCPSSVSNCLNQAMAKSHMLVQTNLALSTYTVSIPSDSNINQALQFLDEQLDLRQHVESAVAEITRVQSPFSKAIRRNYNLADALPATSQYYHSVLFGLSLSTVKPDSNTRTVNLSSLSSNITIEEDNNGNLEKIYPGFNQTTSILDMRRDVLSSDTPFLRTSLEITQNNTFSFIDNQDANRLAALNTSDSFLTTEGFLLYERPIRQKVFNEESATNRIGWEFNPMLSRAYQTNDYEPPSSLADINEEPDYGSAPTWLTSSNYTKAASYKLSGTQKPYTRVENLEDAHMFLWEIHGLETNKDPGFSVSAMNGKEYGAISYSLKLDDNTNIIQLIAETAKWQISAGNNSGTISTDQPSAHYKTFSLSRDNTNITQGVQLENNLIEPLRSITRVASNDPQYPNQGLISFGGQSAGKTLGHSTASGSYLALAFNTQQQDDPLDRGQGLVIASQLANSNYLFTNEVYQLQGNSMEINNEKNIIHQLNGSSLEIESVFTIPTNDCLASLSVTRTSVEHTVGSQENTLSQPIESSQATTYSQACTIEGSELLIEFADIFGEQLTLRGFITHKNDPTSNKPGHLINLIWQQDHQLGLVFANQTQSLSPNFNE